MNFGLPVIVSNTCGSAHDLVMNGKNGFVFKEGDVSELKTQLEDLINDKSLREFFGQQSSEKIKEYSHQITVHNILEAMASI
jgi:glycosyltransferase involved in cell wall biosynthesis